MRPEVDVVVPVPAVVILAAGGARADPTIDALARQTRPPGRVVLVDAHGVEMPPVGAPPHVLRVAGPRAALHAALEGDSPWVWLLDSGVIPRAGALESLLAALERLGSLPAPMLLASRVLTPDGELDPSSLPAPDVHRPELAVAAVDRRFVAIRAARRGSLLVHRRALPRLPSERRELVPSGTAVPLAHELEWTARLLKHELGLLVPASVVIRPTSRPRPGARTLRARAQITDGIRLLAGGALEPRERPWFAFHVAEQLLGTLRAPRTRRRG